METSLTKLGAGVSVGLTLLGGAYKGVQWNEARLDAKYASAAAVQQMNDTLLLIRRDQLAAEARDWQRLFKARTPTNVEQARYDEVQRQLRLIDEQLRPR